MIILSHLLWQRRYAGSHNVIGRQVMLEGVGFTIIGVMSADFHYHQRFDFWIPWHFAEELSNRDSRHYTVARVKPGLTPEQIAAQTDAVLRNISAPDHDKGWRMRATPLHDQFTSHSRTALLTLLGAVGFVLVIACINVANMLLARASDRSREISIRAALGAGRMRAFQQVLIESLLLALIGGVAGMLLGGAGVHALMQLFPERMPVPRLDQTRVDAVVLTFACVISMATGVIFGVMPALQASRLNLMEALKTGTRGAGDGKRLRMVRSGLILVETALSVILLIGAGLMLRSFARLMNSDFGFNPDRVLTLRIAAPSYLKEKPQQIAHYTRLLDQVQSVPGLSAAGIIGPLPLGGVDGTGTFVVKGRRAERQMVKLRTASPGYFTAMGLTLLRGRVFYESDTADAPKVVVISDSLARRHFPGEDPIGRQTGGSDEGPWYTIVGVVRDVKHVGLADDAMPELYHPLQQFIYSPFMTTLVVRTAGADPTAVAATIQKKIWAVNVDQPINDVLPLTEIVSRSAAQPRLYALLLGTFAGIAMLLAAAGLYGVLSYIVSRRVREIGIRVALGASTRAVMREVVGRSMGVVAVGIVVGVCGAYVLTRLLEAQLYQVKPTDPATYVAVCVLLGLVAAGAASLPARRAARVDPSVTLRCD